jgi:basic amino acid/polyamine antiporter, APA family
MNPEADTRFFTTSTAATIIIANMVGTGVFTSLGYQLEGIDSTFVLLMLWVAGGIAALCGALSYAELGATFPRSGGEYNFLKEIYHPSAGFVSGWISATIGFAAPTALAAITFGTYLSAVFPQLPSTPLACILVLTLAVIHGSNHRNSGGMQAAFTYLKIGFIIGFSVLALALNQQNTVANVVPVASDVPLMLSGTFAVSLIYVSYAYSGWNAATYITSELEYPKRQLPIVLIGGTAIVCAMYVLLNFVFLSVAPREALVGKLEVGYIAATYVFGDIGASVMGVAMAMLLISTVSAMIIAAPRVLHAIGEDFPAFRFLGVLNANGVPSRAIYMQSAITILFILTGTFESILVFAGFTMALNTLFAVSGLLIYRWRKPSHPRPYKAWGYPVTPLVFLMLTGWTLAFILIERPQEALLGLAIIGTGFVIYAVAKRIG